MGCIDNGWRAEGAHDTEATHVNDEVLVAEGGSAVGLPDFLRAGFLEFTDHELHLVGRKELAFLDVHSAVGFRGCNQKVGLSAEERRDLQCINDIADLGALLREMDIGDAIEAVLGFDGAEDLESFVQTGAPVTFDGGAVCLVEGAFEKDVELRVLPLQGFERVSNWTAGVEPLE